MIRIHPLSSFIDCLASLTHHILLPSLKGTITKVPGAVLRDTTRLLSHSDHSLHPTQHRTPSMGSVLSSPASSRAHKEPIRESRLTEFLLAADEKFRCCCSNHERESAKESPSSKRLCEPALRILSCTVSSKTPSPLFW